MGSASMPTYRDWTTISTDIRRLSATARRADQQRRRFYKVHGRFQRRAQREARRRGLRYSVEATRAAACEEFARREKRAGRRIPFALPVGKKRL
jgi:hypothetical protein